MQPRLSSHRQLSQSGLPQQVVLKASGAGRTGALRQWLTRTIRYWQRKKMIAALQAMDSRILRDIGIERCDIERIVDGFDDRELRMVPMAPSQPPAYGAAPSFRSAA